MYAALIAVPAASDGSVYEIAARPSEERAASRFDRSSVMWMAFTKTRRQRVGERRGRQARGGANRVHRRPELRHVDGLNGRRAGDDGIVGEQDRRRQVDVAGQAHVRSVCTRTRYRYVVLGVSVVSRKLLLKGNPTRAKGPLLELRKT
jgi:hypothetical protein